MKNSLFCLLLAVGALLAGCSKNGEVGGFLPDDDRHVAIRLNSGIGDAGTVASKAPVTTSAEVQIEGWESSSTVDYTGAPAWRSSATVLVNATASAITLSPVQYYNAAEQIKTFIKGWYPKVASANGTVAFTNTDGTVDVLYAAEVSGSKDVEVSDALVFNHKSTQLVFKVVKGDGLAAGTQIKTIKVKNTAIPTSLRLSTNTVTYTEAAQLAVPNITVKAIGATAEQAGDPLMVRPESSLSNVKLYIETVKADGTSIAAIYDDVPLTTSDNKLTEGSAYTVTLTFKQAEIALNANITPWTTAVGGGDII